MALCMLGTSQADGHQGVVEGENRCNQAREGHRRGTLR